jgi:hypothetical protein
MADDECLRRRDKTEILGAEWVAKGDDSGHSCSVCCGESLRGDVNELSTLAVARDNDFG